jgi:hypothetical protein
MRRQFPSGSSKRWFIYLLGTFCLASAFCRVTFARSDSDSNPSSKVIARGGGTTIIEGGTGAPGFTPVLTKIAFHAEREGGAVTGGFECLALAPGATTGAGSGQFIVNAMYVTGQITGAALNGDTATLTGTANIMGLGAGKNVSFTFEVRKGGPGATSVLTVDSLPTVVFNEILIEGAFQVRRAGRED